LTNTRGNGRLWRSGVFKWIFGEFDKGEREDCCGELREEEEERREIVRGFLEGRGKREREREEENERKREKEGVREKDSEQRNHVVFEEGGDGETGGGRGTCSTY